MKTKAKPKRKAAVKSGRKVTVRRKAVKKSAAAREGVSGRAYVYGVARGMTARQLSSVAEAVGVAGLRLIGHGKIVAVVNDIGSEAVGPEGDVALREAFRTHSEVMQKLAETVTLLPVRRGTMYADAASVVERVLKPQERAIEKMLKRVEGTVEMAVRVGYVEQELLRSVVTANPKLAREASAGSVYHARTEAAKRIGEIMAEMRRRDGQWVARQLKPMAREMRAEPLAGELMVFNGALLVERGKIKGFAKALAKLEKEAGGKLKFEVTGPRVGYSFAEVIGGD